MNALKSRLRYVLHLGIAVVTLSVALHFTSSAGVPSALAYSCGNPSSGHCYGITDWNWTGTAANGSSTKISIVNLNCADYCNDGFIDDEMWLQQNGNGACPTGACWVESGYYHGSGVASTVYFWADSRPNGTFNLHFLSTVPTGDYSHTTTFTIVQTATWNQWEVVISDYVGNQWINYSTNNGMTPDEIIIGMELAGPGGMSAPRADFTYNQWHSSAGWNYQTSGTGYVPFHNAPSPNPPPYGGTASSPNGSTNHGGDIYTYCC